MQYVACKFRSTDTRTYTYFNDGPPVAVGDEVKVADNRDDGWKRVEVVSITATKSRRSRPNQSLGLRHPAITTLRFSPRFMAMTAHHRQRPDLHLSQ